MAGPMTARTALLSVLALAAAAEPAAAQEPPPAPPPTATLTLTGERDGAALAGAPLRTTGQLTPAVAGERVTVRAFAGGRKVAVRAATVDAAGRFTARLRVRRSGTVVLRASHGATPAAGAAVARPVRMDVLPRRVTFRQGGAPVRMLQRHLARRGYVVGRRGVFDARTARAVLALRKVVGMRRTSVADRGVMHRLAAGGGFYRLRFPRHGKHIEADLSRQVMVLARGRRVERIYPVSSGAPVTPTIRGSFRFYMSQPGLNSKEMFFSQYFKGGYAIHGYKSVPTYPASHGCLRVPIPDARSIYDWIKLGDRIDVYA